MTHFNAMTICDVFFNNQGIEDSSLPGIPWPGVMNQLMELMQGNNLVNRFNQISTGPVLEAEITVQWSGHTLATVRLAYQQDEQRLYLGTQLAHAEDGAGIASRAYSIQEDEGVVITPETKNAQWSMDTLGKFIMDELARMGALAMLQANTVLFQNDSNDELQAKLRGCITKLV